MAATKQKQKILMTRPRAASLRWASSLAARGYECAVDPLLCLSTTAAPRPAGSFGGVIFTSTNAPEALLEKGETLADLLTLPCYCVGPSTAAAARAFGFGDVRVGPSDSKALAELIVVETQGQAAKPGLLHVCGETVDRKAHEALAAAGIPVTVWAIYRASPAEDLAPETLDLLRHNAIAFVPVFSPRSARILVSLIEKNHLVSHCHRVTAVALSPAVADVLKTLPWRRLRVAAAPREDEMLACLNMEVAMTETKTETKTVEPKTAVEAAAVEEPVVAKCRRRACRQWYLFGGLVLIGCGLIPSVYYRFLAPPPVIAPAPKLAAPESRAILPPAPETPSALVTVTHPAVPEEQPAAAPSASSAASLSPAVLAAKAEDRHAEVAALAETVKALQTEVAALQTARAEDRRAAHDWVAAALAYGDVRAAARDGLPFAAPLARLATLNQAALKDALTALAPHAASGAPTVAQLRAELEALSPTLKPPVAEGEGPAWLVKLRRAISSLISVHPAQNDTLAPVEAALGKSDLAAAATAASALPEWAQPALADWTAQLAARRAVEDGLAALAAAFAPQDVSAAPVSQPAPQPSLPQVEATP